MALGVSLQLEVLAKLQARINHAADAECCTRNAKEKCNLIRDKRSSWRKFRRKVFVVPWMRSLQILEISLRMSKWSLLSSDNLTSCFVSNFQSASINLNWVNYHQQMVCRRKTRNETKGVRNENENPLPALWVSQAVGKLCFYVS